MPSQTIMVLGSDGYTGWPLTCSLLSNGYTVIGIDNQQRRRLAHPSITPISSHAERASAANSQYPGHYHYHNTDITNRTALRDHLATYEPDTVVNLAQLPSAPYSMRGPQEAWHVQSNNVQGSLNLMWSIHSLGLDTHVVQLATMGEYGTPDTQIPEGFLEDGRPAPKMPGSLYHASKVQMTTNTLHLSRTWNIPVTEVYQGIVYGLSTPGLDLAGPLATRFDVDDIWGTVINRFTAQAAADYPLTVYGAGGQKRAVLPLADCLQCLRLVIDTPPSRENPGRYPYRAVNQFQGAYRVLDLAQVTQDAVEGEVNVRLVENPRVEDDSPHQYDPERRVLDRLGYTSQRSVREEVAASYDRIKEYADRVREEDVLPDVEWR